MINCFGCLKSIDDKYYLLVGNKFYWHFNCLKCRTCQCSLENKCYLSNGHFYCRQHYVPPLHSQSEYIATNANKENVELNRCKKCKEIIRLDDLVIRLKQPVMCLYHLNCFSCHQCNGHIRSGEPYGLVSSANGEIMTLFCNQHYFSSQTQSNTNEILKNSTSEFSVNSVTKSIDLNNNNLQKQKQQQQQLNIPKSSNNEINMKKSMKSAKNFNSKCNSNQNGREGANKRNKRYRTSFKHQQLGVLKAYFQMNPNPDSKDLTVLSKRTGLQNRVLQVWFQNARAKQRKSSNVNCTNEKQSMARNFYSSIIENEFNSLNKSVLEEEEEEEEEDENDDDNDEDDDDLDQDEDRDDYQELVNSSETNRAINNNFHLNQQQIDIFSSTSSSSTSSSNISSNNDQKQLFCF